MGQKGIIVWSKVRGTANNKMNVNESISDYMVSKMKMDKIVMYTSLGAGAMAAVLLGSDHFSRRYEIAKAEDANPRISELRKENYTIVDGGFSPDVRKLIADCVRNGMRTEIETVSIETKYGKMLRDGIKCFSKD
jgi:hypothetical protein